MKLRDLFTVLVALLALVAFLYFVFVHEPTNRSPVDPPNLGEPRPSDDYDCSSQTDHAGRGRTWVMISAGTQCEAPRFASEVAALCFLEDADIAVWSSARCGWE